MAVITWDGSESGGVFTDGANWVGGSAPSNGDSILFDSTSNGATGNDCNISALTISSSQQYHDITIASTYTGTITFSNTLDVRLDGALLVHKANSLKGTGTTTFTFLGSPSVDTYDGAGAAYTKALVNFTADTSVWNAGRDTFTFNFGSQTFSMVDGAYPNITYTGEMKAKKIYSDASRTDFNNYGSVDMLNFNGDDVTSSDYDIYDYTKEYLFEGTLTAIGEYFRFGHTTARFKTLKTSSYGSLNFPVTGSTNFGNTTTKNFYAQYNKLQIEANDVIDNYWKIPAGLTLECNELVIKDGGRIYGEVGTDNKAASIKCVKRPTIRGDWNFRQIADGVYETIGAFSNTPVFHGGTGRQTLTKNSVLYGNGMDAIGMTTNILHPLFFERSALDTNAVDFRVPTVQSSTANPNSYPMPYAGTVLAATFLFSGATISTTGNTNTLRVRKNGGSSGSDIEDFTFNEGDLTNTNGTNYTFVKTGLSFTFSAGDIVQVKRQSGATDLNNGQALLWIKFDY